MIFVSEQYMARCVHVENKCKGLTKQLTSNKHVKINLP